MADASGDGDLRPSLLHFVYGVDFDGQQSRGTRFGMSNRCRKAGKGLSLLSLPHNTPSNLGPLRIRLRVIFAIDCALKLRSGMEITNECGNTDQQPTTRASFRVSDDPRT
jgi:hypothetical protein